MSFAFFVYVTGLLSSDKAIKIKNKLWTDHLDSTQEKRTKFSGTRRSSVAEDGRVGHFPV